MRCTLILAVLGLLFFPVMAAAAPPASEAGRIVERPDLQREFEALGTIGTMVVRQTGHLDRTVIVGQRRSHTRYLPSSTFKIPNSLIAIDAGSPQVPSRATPAPTRTTSSPAARCCR